MAYGLAQRRGANKIRVVQKRDAVHSAAEDEFLVAGEHAEALRKPGVPFEDLTELGTMGKLKNQGS